MPQGLVIGGSLLRLRASRQLMAASRLPAGWRERASVVMPGAWSTETPALDGLGWGGECKFKTLPLIFQGSDCSLSLPFCPSLPESISPIPAIFSQCLLRLSKYFLYFFRILVPQPGIELAPSKVKAQSPNHWAPREFPQNIFLS